MKVEIKNYLKNRRKSDYFFDGFIVLSFILFFFTSFPKTLSIWYHQFTMESPSLNAGEKSVVLSKNAYNWKLKNLNGEIVELSDFKNQPIFLSFWALFCTSCLAELPGIDKINQEFSDKMIFLLVDSIDSPEKIEAFLRKKGYNFEVYQPIGELPADFSASIIPSNYIISAKGEILFAKTGAVDWGHKSTKDWLRSILN